MGTYLATGIVQKMLISKREMGNNPFPIKNIIESLQKEIMLEHYVFGENEQALFWKIKPQMLEGNFTDFLQDQFKMSGRTIDPDVLTHITDAKSGDKIIELAKSRPFYDFQIVDNIIAQHKAVRESGYSDYVTVYYDVIAFFMDGKIIMECYGNILHYFESNIRLQESKYPVVACLKTMITS